MHSMAEQIEGVWPMPPDGSAHCLLSVCLSLSVSVCLCLSLSVSICLGPDGTGRHGTGRDGTGQDRTRQDKTRQDKTRQDKTRQDRLDSTGQGNISSIYRPDIAHIVTRFYLFRLFLIGWIAVAAQAEHRTGILVFMWGVFGSCRGQPGSLARDPARPAAPRLARPPTPAPTQAHRSARPVCGGGASGAADAGVSPGVEALAEGAARAVLLPCFAVTFASPLCSSRSLSVSLCLSLSFCLPLPLSRSL